MRSAIRRLSLTAAVALACTVAGAQEFGRVEAVIDPSTDRDAAMEAVQALGAALAGTEYAVLDLQVVLVDPEGGEARVSVERGGADAVPLDCGGGFGRLDVAGAVLTVYLADLYTHLILSLRFGPEDAGIGNTVACTFRQDQPVLTVTGRFYVSHVGIPTADDIQLVAVRP